VLAGCARKIETPMPPLIQIHLSSIKSVKAERFGICFAFKDAKDEYE
jgi:hypothetical protein